MRVLRFDHEVAVPFDDDGYRVGPLTGDGSDVRVEVLHLPAGGRVHHRATDAQHLLAVIAGDGWARSAPEGRRRPLGPAYAAVWDPGEGVEVGTDGGLTGVRVEGCFDVWARTVTKEIVVSDYDPVWVEWFGTVRCHVWPAIDDVALRIDHVGSTSVPGLAAKPIIDMDIVVASEADIRPVIERVVAIGYRWRGDLGVVGRQTFEPEHDKVLPPHHLYLVVEDNRAHLDHWLLRDLLRRDAGARERYAALKRHNAEAADGDIDVYVAAKAAFVAELLTRARADRGLPPVSYWEPEVDLSEPG